MHYHSLANVGSLKYWSKYGHPSLQNTWFEMHLFYIFSYKIISLTVKQIASRILTHIYMHTDKPVFLPFIKIHSCLIMKFSFFFPISSFPIYLQKSSLKKKKKLSNIFLK